MGGNDDNGAGHNDGFDESEELGTDEVVVIHDGERERQCVVLAVAELNGDEFALLAPQEQLADVPEDEEEGQLELFIFRYGTDAEGRETFVGIDDDALFERVREFFSTLIDTDDDDDDDESDA